MTSPGFIQIAGVLDREEADLLVRAGVDTIGFPLHLAHHSADLSESQTAEVIAGLPRHVTPVLITYLDRAAAIIELCRRIGTQWVQIHGDISLRELKKVKAGSGIKVIKSLIIGRDQEASVIERLQRWSPYVDWFITDTYDPETGACGATGKTHDWAVSRRLVELSPRPVFLAGGLNPKNVYQAVSLVRPAGVDAHSGVENGTGRKSEHKVVKFVREARRANR